MQSFSMDRSQVLPTEAVRILQDHVRQMTLIQMWLLALWLLVISLQRVCENLLCLCVHLWFVIQRSAEEKRGGTVVMRSGYVARGTSRVSRENAKATAEMHWGDLAENPEEWWDNRGVKKNPRAPDFKHRTSHRGLWIDNLYTPDWARAKFKVL